jgi:molybdopterin converting factor small subunit
MGSDAECGMVTVRMFGALREARRGQGLPPTADVEVPQQGVPAARIAQDLGLPVASIEGVFCNHSIHPLTQMVYPGDSVAFVPHGTPGPHRFFLGLYNAGHGEE